MSVFENTRGGISKRPFIVQQVLTRVHSGAARAQQRALIDFVIASHVPTRWALKSTLLARRWQRPFVGTLQRPSGIAYVASCAPVPNCSRNYGGRLSCGPGTH